MKILFYSFMIIHWLEAQGFLIKFTSFHRFPHCNGIWTNNNLRGTRWVSTISNSPCMSSRKFRLSFKIFDFFHLWTLKQALCFSIDICKILRHGLLVVSAGRTFGQALLLAPSRDNMAIIVHENKKTTMRKAWRPTPPVPLTSWTKGQALRYDDYGAAPTQCHPEKALRRSLWGGAAYVIWVHAGYSKRAVFDWETLLLFF